MRQISNLFRIMKSVVWRQKSNMIKKQDSSFSYRNHSSLTPKTSGPSPGPSPVGRGVVCEVTPIRLLAYFVKVFSLTELTDLTELFNQRFELTERLRHTEFTEASPPAPLRMERGVVCEVTPIGLLIEGDRLLNIWRTCRGISVITPLSIRRGAGGEASVGCKVL